MPSWVWDGSEACQSSLHKYDLLVSDYFDPPHLLEVFGPTAYEDYGEIHIGDIIHILDEKVYITPFRSH